MTEAGLKGLLMSTKCKTWLYAEDDFSGPLIEAGSEMQICALPSLEWMLCDEGHKWYGYDKTFEQAAWDKIFIVHTSGTTGKQRPIVDEI